MKIFTTVDVIGQGLPLIMPNGVIMMQELQRWIEDEETKRGYVRTKTPLMAKSDLYKISGHWDHYKDGMFVLGDEEKDKEVLCTSSDDMSVPVLCIQSRAAQLP